MNSAGDLLTLIWNGVPIRALHSRARRRLGQHPGADVVDQSGFLGKPDEFPRQYHAMPQMMPACQRFGLGDDPGFQVDDWLTKHFQLFFCQRMTQFVDDLQAYPCGIAHGDREETETVAAGLLGDVHCLVGIADQVAGRTGVLRVQRDADAARNVDLIRNVARRPGDRLHLPGVVQDRHQRVAVGQRRTGRRRT